MNRAEFIALPAPLALRLVWDVIEDQLEGLEAPKPPRSPKYDRKIYRKGGFQWASETDLESLNYWRGLAAKSADNGGEYAEKDAKQRDALDRWIEWRLCFPSETWRGTRGDDEVRADPPSGKPEVREHTRRAGGGSSAATPSGGGFHANNDDDDDDIPF